ncbi:hypothetical protein FKW77_004994 [Venturia effusa]|uniref:Protein-lysine N-methyltransferase EFM5 n=1 Tax=Venturia effusa TaxID=50376 RepID=A0A517L799_9PEZI|nr:hypothetical protein FKW77_004994 [Venturia effusa]
MSDSDSEPELSSAALDALKQFYTDKESRQKAFEDLKAVAEDDFSSGNPAKSLKYPLSMEAFTEDWNASQFWYTDSTATTLAKQLLENCTAETNICVLSAPSVFLQVKNLLNEWDGIKARPAQITLLEFDTRFGVFGKEFQFYDFKYPTKLPAELKAQFDVIIIDPPFLSEDCQTKTALTVRWLAKRWEKEELRLIACTGERMEGLIHKLYSKVGVRTTDFVVEHAKGLSNEFRCYANFECGEWGLLE